MVRGIRTEPRIPWPSTEQYVCERVGLAIVAYIVTTITSTQGWQVCLPGRERRRSHHGRGLFSARTLLFFVDPEKSCLGATVRQRRIVAKIRRTKHHRRQYIYTTGADSSGSFLRRTCQTLNASKSVRIWTPNRAEVDRCVPRPRARAAVRTTGAYFSRLARSHHLFTLL